MKRLLILLGLVLALAAPVAANAGRVPPGTTIPNCTRAPLPGYTEDLRLCSNAASAAVNTNVTLTVSATLAGAPAANGTPLFLYYDLGSGELTFIGSCWTYGGGCSFVVTRSVVGPVVFRAYAGGVLSGGLTVTWV